MRFVFVETSLETIPEEIANHPIILRDARRKKVRPEFMILDDSRHHRAMGGLEKREKRGRPDIIHQCLLAVLDSKLDAEIYIHTVRNQIIWVNRETRIPRNYNRFLGLMEDLFRKKEIQASGKTLLAILDKNLTDILTENTVVLEKGYDSHALLERNPENLAVCVGGFPHGDFDKETLRIFDRVKARFAGFGETDRTSLYATYKAVCMLESFFGL